jgi:hypothetical protein
MGGIEKNWRNRQKTCGIGRKQAEYAEKQAE